MGFYPPLIKMQFWASLFWIEYKSSRWLRGFFPLPKLLPFEVKPDCACFYVWFSKVLLLTNPPRCYETLTHEKLRRQYGCGYLSCDTPYNTPCSFFVTQVQVIYISRGYVLDDSTQNNCKCICQIKWQCPANIQGINYHGVIVLFSRFVYWRVSKSQNVGSMACNDDGTKWF